jgi:hypothetical protein
VSPHLSGVHRPGRFDYGLDVILAGLQTKVAHWRSPLRSGATDR